MNLSDLVSTYERLIEDIHSFSRHIYDLSDEELDEFLVETARQSEYYEGTLSTLHEDAAQINAQLKVMLSLDPDLFCHRYPNQ